MKRNTSIVLYSLIPFDFQQLCIQCHQANEYAQLPPTTKYFKRSNARISECLTKLIEIISDFAFIIDFSFAGFFCVQERIVGRS